VKKYYLATLTAVVFWSASFIATSIAYITIAPLQLGMVRGILPAFLFAVMRLFTKNRERPSKGDLPRVALSGLFGVTLYFTFQNIGVDMTTSSNAALITASFPAMTLLLESLIDRVVPAANKIAGIVIAMIGVGILTGATAEGSSNQALGNLCLLGAGLVWAVYSMLTRAVAQKYSAATVTTYQMLFGGIFFIPIALLEGKPWQLPTLSTAGAILFLCVGCSLLAYVLYNYGLQKISAGVAVSMVNLVPALGLVFSFVILHEAISARQIIGGLIVVAGVTLSSVQFPKKRERA
jgi:drug/metabolite transporter (DMT)-like permease